MNRQEAALRIAELNHAIQGLELEKSAIRLAEAETASLELAGANWLTIASSVLIWQDLTGDQDSSSTRQRLRRLCERGEVTARRRPRNDGQPGKLWQINKLSLVRYCEKRRDTANGVDYNPAERPPMGSI